VNSYHLNKFFKLEEEINCPFKKNERQLSKKKPNAFSNSISSFFASKKPFKKDDMHQKLFLEDLTL
jgi:hypothetical protein